MPFDPFGENEGEDDPRWGDPERDLPGDPERTLPGDPEHTLPDVPAPDTDEGEVDPDLLAAFWRSVALANVALGGVAVGPMFVYFEGMWIAGSAAVAVGVLAALRIRQHRRVVERVAGDGADTTTEATGAADAGEGDRDPTTERNA